MSIKYKLLLLVCLIFSNTQVVYAQNSFSWEMLLPAVTNQCRPDNLSLCHNQIICESRKGYWYLGACHSEPEPTCSETRLDLCNTSQGCSDSGGYWYEDSCHTDPQQLVCSQEHLDLCFTAQECASIGGFWYELSCHLNKSANYIATEKLVGDWLLTTFHAGGNVTRTYTINNSLIEDPYGSGKFIIEGTDRVGDTVTGTYYEGTNSYMMYVSKTALDIQYEFSFILTSDVSGCYFEIDKSDKTQGPCISMQGSRL